MTIFDVAASRQMGVRRAQAPEARVGRGGVGPRPRSGCRSAGAVTRPVGRSRNEDCGTWRTDVVGAFGQPQYVSCCADRGVPGEKVVRGPGRPERWERQGNVCPVWIGTLRAARDVAARGRRSVPSGRGRRVPRRSERSERQGKPRPRRVGTFGAAGDGGFRRSAVGYRRMAKVLWRFSRPPTEARSYRSCRARGDGTRERNEAARDATGGYVEDVDALRRRTRCRAPDVWRSALGLRRSRRASERVQSRIAREASLLRVPCERHEPVRASRRAMTRSGSGWLVGSITAPTWGASASPKA